MPEVSSFKSTNARMPQAFIHSVSVFRPGRMCSKVAVVVRIVVVAAVAAAVAVVAAAVAVVESSRSANGDEDQPLATR